MTENKYRKGWDAERVQRVLEHYDEQPDEEAVAEDEAGFEPPEHTALEVPIDMLPAIRELLAKRAKGA
jgi:hypothetical protein